MEKDTRRIDYCFDQAYRYRRLNELREELGLGLIDYKECFSDDLPSVGIEIEMTWDQAFIDMASWKQSLVRPKQLDPRSEEYRIFSENYARNDQQLKPTLENISEVIPRVGTDAYWEFSFLPTKNITVLEGEVKTLFDAGILRVGEEYATHLTISGVSSKRDAYAVMVACEISGGTTSDRLQAPVASLKGAWSRRSDVKGGMRRRASHELYGTDSIGYELRTLVTIAPDQIIRTVQLAQELVRMMNDDPDRWVEVRTNIEELLAREGLPLADWESPRTRPDVWQKYFQLIGQSNHQFISMN